MYLIALCDDETEQLQKTTQMIKEYQYSHTGEDFRVECFESADKMLDLIEEKEYFPDLILMDIYMPDRKSVV